MKKIIFAVIALFFTQIAVGQQWGKYTLYCGMNSNTGYLLDTNNNIYHTWNFTGGQTGYSAYLLENRVLLRTVKKTGNFFTGGPICGRVQKVAWDGTVLWEYDYSTQQYCSHHDIHPMPNGNVLMIAYESIPAADVTAAGGNQNIIMWPDKIVEIEPVGTNGGNVVWEWRAWDHLVQNVDPADSNYQTSIVNHPELLNINYNQQKDWMHMNGLDYNDSLDQIAFSCHNLDEVYIIDHSTTTAEAASHSGGNSGKGGDILYRWGNPAAYQASGTQILKVTHDAHWIRRNCPQCPDANRLVAFNNDGISMNQSCVDQIDLPYNGYNYSITLGQAFTPTTYNERHACTGHTSNMGGSQQMPNGNMIVTIATSGFVYEVDSLGNTLWQYNGSGFCPKAWRYTECYVDGTIPTPTITVSGDTLSSSSAYTYQWYQDGTLIPGATSQTYVPTANGDYQVIVTSDEGCVSDSSLAYTYTAAAGTDNPWLSGKIVLYPNPTSGVLNILDNAGLNGKYTVTVMDIAGKEMTSAKGVNSLDISSLNSGIYFVRVQTEDKGFVTKKINLIR